MKNMNLFQKFFFLILLSSILPLIGISVFTIINERNMEINKADDENADDFGIQFRFNRQLSSAV